MSDRAAFSPIMRFEYSLHYRINRESRVGPLNKKVFTNARDAVRFMDRLSSLGTMVAVTICKREVGSWDPLERADLEADAVGEAPR